MRLSKALRSAIAIGALLAMLPAASAAHTLNTTDEAHLHVVHASGSLLIEEGHATGSLPGTVQVRFHIDASITGTYTIYPSSGGSITGHGTATLHSSGTYASFAGTVTVTGGTGRYTHAHGTGGLYGTVNRRTDTLLVQTTGRLSY